VRCVVFLASLGTCGTRRVATPSRTCRASAAVCSSATRSLAGGLLLRVEGLGALGVESPALRLSERSSRSRAPLFMGETNETREDLRRDPGGWSSEGGREWPSCPRGRAGCRGSLPQGLGVGLGG